MGTKHSIYRQPDYSRYARLKSEWQHQNPTASPAEYTRAMRVIARRCGV